MFSNEDEPRALSKGDESKDLIALTFNISWGTEKVDDVLAQLKAHKVKATFFVSGEWAERHPDLLEKISEGNHEIGMMGYRYDSYLEQKTEQVKTDLQKAKEIFDKLGYDQIELIRPPHGHFNKDVIELAEQEGLKVVQWSINTHDWENPGKDKIIDQVVKEGDSGDIVLMHASDSVKQTPEALEVILPGLKQKGLKLASVSQLITGDQTTTKEAD
ncbi:polysaccharide deacetylase family sporulation protein PdaB [Thalassobacillus sp. CUG 92003]|uniref:polysaccharide deacetylase family sporulation protein PdaB n=1 Tax=Thalassobacillus sp. CUG 92003 TaxID=2736641 RepID=UPI00351A81BB